MYEMMPGGLGFFLGYLCKIWWKTSVEFWSPTTGWFLMGFIPTVLFLPLCIPRITDCECWAVWMFFGGWWRDKGQGPCLSRLSHRWVSCAPCVSILLTREVGKNPKDNFQCNLPVVQHLLLRAHRQRHVRKTTSCLKNSVIIKRICIS